MGACADLLGDVGVGEEEDDGSVLDAGDLVEAPQVLPEVLLPVSPTQRGTGATRQGGVVTDRMVDRPSLNYQPERTCER